MAATVVVLLGGLCAPAAAASRQTASAHLSSEAPGSPTGSELLIRWFNHRF